MDRDHVEGRITLVILVVLWAWCGTVYHLLFFTRINPAAYFFAAMFLTQSAILAVASFRTRHLPRRTGSAIKMVAGTLIVTYGLAIYPVIGYLLGHVYPRSPTFGLPCPLTIFTFGVVLMKNGAPRYVLVIPIVWALIATSAAVLFGIYEDLGLILAALVAVPLRHWGENLAPVPA